MQTTFQKEKAVKLGSVRFDADFGNGYVNLGGLKDAALNISLNVIQLIVDNAKMSPKTKISALTLTANLYEFDLENLSKITGLGELTSTAGSSTAYTQTIGNVSANQVVILEKQNGNGTAISALTSLKSGNTSVADYTLVQVDGKTAIQFTTDKTNVVAVYNYTPAANKELLFRDVITSQALNKFRFVNTDEDGKTFTIEFPKGYSSGDSIEYTFQSDETTDDAANFPITITAFPGDDQSLCRIIDEQNIA